jgi:hypothetical protein
MADLPQGNSIRANMNTNLLNALKEIVSQHGGVETLSDAKRVKALLADLAAAEPRPQKIALIACVELGFVSLLQNVPAGEQDAAMAKLAERLNNEEGIDPVLCADTLNILGAALFGDRAPQMTAQEAVGQSGGAAEFDVSEKTAETAALTANVERLIKERTQHYEEMTGLTTSVERLTKERDQSNTENRKVKKTLKQMKRGLIAAIIGVVISIFVGYGNYSSARSELQYANYYGNQLARDFEMSKNLWVVNPTEIKVGNWGNNRWLTQPGDTLYSEQMRYFNPVITCNAPFGSNVVFYIKIFDPNGNLKHDDTSPDGYTYSRAMWVGQGDNQTLDLNFWENPGSSIYQAGEWTVEVWCNDVCLLSEKVRIN